MGRNKVPEHMIVRMLEMCGQGYTYGQIAQALYLGTDTVCKYLSGQHHVRRVSDVQRRRIRELRENGWTMRAIALEIGMSVSSVEYWLRKRIKRAGKYRFSKEQLCWACARSAAGKDRQGAWDARLQPVEGWVLDEDGFVVSCPEFEEAER